MKNETNELELRVAALETKVKTLTDKIDALEEWAFVGLSIPCWDPRPVVHNIVTIGGTIGYRMEGGNNE